MRYPAALPRPALVVVLVSLLTLAGCFGGGGSLNSSQLATAGNFVALGINMKQGEVWELNRPIRISFNHPIDPDSVSFGSVVIRPISPEIAGRSVTGRFSVEPDGKVLVFRPTCPTNELLDNGGLVPGLPASQGYTYEVSLPTQATFGQTVLRDTAGHPLKTGLQRSFRTPVRDVEPLFLDLVPGPAVIDTVIWPKRLNMFADPEPRVEIRFNQPIDGRASNLNTEKLYILYSDAEIPGGGGPSTFSPANLLPGKLILSQNCTSSGATVLFQISGILPPNRRLRLEVSNQFADITGETNVSKQVWSPDHEIPTLAAVYNDVTWDEEDETIDEFSEQFDTTGMIASADELVLPPATIQDGFATASFEFPGKFVPPESDFFVDESFIEVFTDGQTIFTDSNNRDFTVSNGVIFCDDFTITAGSALRGRGRNPLVIYATGNVTIDGELDVSGNNSNWPTSLNSPQFPEGGAIGECGGGDGGDASQVTDAETTRGENGDGPFLILNGGAQGGEGAFQSSEGQGSGDYQTARLIAGGAAGGTFAKTVNVAVVYDEWSGRQNPGQFDNRGPDYSSVRHPLFDPDTITGGENGNRGSSFESRNDPNTGTITSGPHGMEDESADRQTYDGASSDPGSGVTWKCDYADPAYDGDVTYFPYADLTFQAQFPVPDDLYWNWAMGHPINGPDPGSTNESPFAEDTLGTANDFWGRRVGNDGTVIVGELLAPWAGYGGGGSGDVQTLKRRRPDGTFPLLADVFPLRPWEQPPGPNHIYYRKGAPGGGGGGQVLLMAIGVIKIGDEGVISAQGGIGHGGESVIFTYNQISGSGGGSGGHIVIHTAKALDLSEVDLGSNPASPQERVIFLAIGGRRGWCASNLNLCSGKGGIGRDGNSQFMMGRGGAGGNGVVQIHVPDPGTNIYWNPVNSNSFNSYIHGGSPTGPLDIDRLEEVLALYSAPDAYALIPFFSSASQLASTWIDTGLGPQLRNPDNGTGSYPKWINSIANFDGIDTMTGEVNKTGNLVTQLGDVYSGTTSGVIFGADTLVIPGASAKIPAHLLRLPGAIVGYDIIPNTADPTHGFEVVKAEFDRANDILSLVTRSTDGSMSVWVGANWALKLKFFRLATSGVKDALPVTAAVFIEFQAADDPEDTATYAPTPGSPGAWTSDLTLLEGKRFLRYRVTFDIDANNKGVQLNSLRPTLDYLKLPFAW